MSSGTFLVSMKAMVEIGAIYSILTTASTDCSWIRVKSFIALWLEQAQLSTTPITSQKWDISIRLFSFQEFLLFHVKVGTVVP
jgi:hypothetical protein